MKKSILMLVALVFVVACNIPANFSLQPATESGEAPETSPTNLNSHRIGIRTVSGEAEFYDTVTGEKFFPRGANYVDFKEITPGELWEDYIFGAGTYKPEAVSAAFHKLSVNGYNTVRIFFDHCGKGPSCIGNPNGPGLNPVFLDHMVEVMHMADAENLHLLFTANGVPLSGQYWERYDAQFQQNPHGFESFYDNGYYMHKAGVDMQVQYWDDLISGLKERNAPFEVMLGWQLQNEYFLVANKAPLSWTSGSVTISNGKSYDMADENQKRKMATDAVLYWMNALIPVIKRYDPQALVTVGFFAPNFPNDFGLAPEWYRDPASLINIAPVDFWDFHHYPFLLDLRASMQSGAENFGMIGYSAKPVLMGEYGVFRYSESDISRVSVAMQQWMAVSCEFGFDGWMVWEYKDRPASDQVWGMESSADALLKALAPAAHPDPCTMAPLPSENLAVGKQATASSFVPENPPSKAVDDSSDHWIANGFPPQWIEINLGEPVTIVEFKLRVWQVPEGETVHRILVRTPTGDWQAVTELSGFTKDGDALFFTPSASLPGVQFVRIETVKSPSFVAWREIRVFGEAGP